MGKQASGWYIDVVYKDGSRRTFGPYDSRETAERNQYVLALKDDTKSFPEPYFILPERKIKPPEESGDPHWIDIGEGIQVHIDGSSLTLYRNGENLYHENVLRKTSFQKTDFEGKKNIDGTYIIAWRAGFNHDIMAAWAVVGNKQWFSGMQMHPTRGKVDIRIVSDNVVQFVGGNGEAIFLKFNGPKDGWRWPLHDARFADHYVFDADFYLGWYEDLQGNHAAALDHWLRHGIDEGRISSRAFDVEFYLGQYSDLQKVFGKNNYAAAIDHWLRYGIDEGRRSSRAFDVEFYLGQYSDLQKAFGKTGYKAAIDHWLSFGIKEGRRGSRAFDVEFYLGKYPDLQKAFGKTGYKAAIDHWLSFGIKEGRRGSRAFDVEFYLGKYPDLQKAFGKTGYKEALDHWLRNGIKEGRQGIP